MSAYIKQKEEKGKPISWSKPEDYMALKFKKDGKIRVVHKILAERLIAKEKATPEKAEILINKIPNLKK